MGREESIARLKASFQAIWREYERAERSSNIAAMAAFGNALKLIDACISAEEGLFAERDKFGKVTGDPDAQLLTRLREIAVARDIFGHARKGEGIA